MRYLLLNITTLFHQSSGQQSSACAARHLEAFPFILLAVMLCCAQVGCESGCSEISQCSILALFRFGCKNVGALSHHEKTHEKRQCHCWVQHWQLSETVTCHLRLEGQKEPVEILHFQRCFQTEERLKETEGGIYCTHMYLLNNVLVWIVGLEEERCTNVREGLL